jgi:NAD(P)-dependent dehydrogenase (short-subunit alcohol dehydrogenase family)
MRPVAQQTVLITGTTSGLGRATARALADAGARVILHGRDRRKLHAVRQEIHAESGNRRLETVVADLASIAEVRRMTEEIRDAHSGLDLLINNAGVGPGKMPGAHRELSRDGYELRFAVNHLAPFLLTTLLLPLLRESPPSRIVNVTSAGQEAVDFGDVMLERGYDGKRAYHQSKLAQVMFTFDLAERLKDDQITVNCVHPASLMNTKMVTESYDHVLSSIEDGVRSVMVVATSPDLDGITGRYFDQTREGRAHRQAYDREARERLWHLSERLVGLPSAPGARVG